MKRLVLSAFLFACAPSYALAEGALELLGHFDNVTSADQGEHCGGYSLDLWAYRTRVFGLLHRHSGLCGDPACSVIEDASLDRKTGRLAFSSIIQAEKFQFAGSLQGRGVAGKLNERAVRLDRQEAIAGEFEPDTSVAAWCSFWTGVPRCAGVAQLCASLQ